VVGIDCHIGSQITEVAPYLDALDRLLDLVEQIEAAASPSHHIDFGGGLGITTPATRRPRPTAVAAAAGQASTHAALATASS
jgi:diaminopimelate decarboxylase